MTREFIYVGDPMCSWCWGFAPTLDRLQERYDIPLRTVVGGLRPGAGAEQMGPALRELLLEHWSHVEEASGQPFDRAILDRDDWVYDTEPGCRAVVTMRELAPELVVGWFQRLQRAFYAEGTVISDPATLPPLLDGFAVDADKFVELFQSSRMRERTWADFSEARSMGVAGFPTLLYRDDDLLGVVTRGWAPWDQLEPALTHWLEDRYGELAGDLICDVDGGAC